MNHIRLSCFILVLSILCFSCTKKDGAEDNPEDIVEKQRADRAEYNHSQLEGMGNVYVSARLQQGQKAQLYMRSEYAGEDFASYISVNSDGQVGSDHRILLGAKDRLMSVLELEEDRLLRFYVKQSDGQLPLLLELTHHDGSQTEVSLFRILSGSEGRSLLTSVFLRNDEPVGQYTKFASLGDNQSSGMIAASKFGGEDCKRPHTPSTDAAEIGEYLGYIRCAMSPILGNTKLRDALSEGMNSSQDLKPAFSELMSRLEGLDSELQKVGSQFSKFKTDPLTDNDRMKGFDWYERQSNNEIDPSTIKLSPVDQEISLSWDEMDPNSVVKLVLQAVDNSGKEIKEKPVFLDVRFELERDGETHLLLEETKATSTGIGRLEIAYHPKSGKVVPQPGDSFTVHFRPSAGGESAYQKLAVTIVDRNPAKIIIVSGNNQEAEWTKNLESPLVLKVTNKAGEPLENVPLSWKVEPPYSIISDRGKLSESQGYTDLMGKAEALFALGAQYQQGAGLDKITVQVLDKEGRVIPGLEITFTYIMKRKKFTLVLLKPLDMTRTNWEEVGEWKSGDEVMMNYNEELSFKLKLDGEILNDHYGKPYIVGALTKNLHKGPAQQSANHPFQAEDIYIKDCPIRFAVPMTSEIDSITVNLTISNRLYRAVVGKTIKLVGSSKPSPAGFEQNYNVGEILTYKFRTDGKVETSSMKYPAHTGLSNYSDGIYGGHFSGYVPVYPDCNQEKYTMKKVVGIISGGGASPNHRLGGSFVLFEDSTFVPITTGTGYSECKFKAFWESLTLGL